MIECPFERSFLEGHQEEVDIIQMEPCGGFIKDEEVFTFLAMVNVVGQFEALGFSSTQGIGRLAKREVTQTHLL